MADRRHRPDTCRQALLSLVREAGFSATEAGRRLGVHDSTARRWVRLSGEGIEHRKTGSGKRRVSTRAQDAVLVTEVEVNPHQSASSITVNAHFPGSSHTVMRHLRDVGRYPRVAVIKGCITDDHRLFRLAFAEENVNFDWNKNGLSLFTRSECPRKCVVGGEENCECDDKYNPHRPITKDALWNIIEDAWDRVSSRRQYLRCLITSIPRRMQAVIDAEGLHIRY
ncbi:hypothetical protein ANN_24704 [Periplaneta americana]|uniref:Transposase n=1 Tax=Periplaneta americana TaxID=6978 RepID=A0ABQ8RZC8_PERAM|nr:hypothetical protein ANN_24704 [Periplaneta americana]